MNTVGPDAALEYDAAVADIDGHIRAYGATRGLREGGRDGEGVGGGGAQHAAGDQGLTLVHFSAQPQPFLTQNYTLNTP